MGKRKIPLEDEPIICQEYLGGLSMYKLADKYNMSVSGIYALLNRNQIERRDNKVLTPAQEIEAINLYLSGQSVFAVGDKFGIHGTTIPLILARHGYSCRPAGHNSRQYHLDEFAFDKIDNERAAYFLGVIYADGCVREGNSLRIAIAKKDAVQLRRFRAFICSNAPIRYYKIKTPQGKRKDTCKIDIYSNHLCGRLEELGVVPYRGKFERTLVHLPREMYRHFIRGLVDGDGAIDTYKRNNARIRILGQPDILDWIRLAFYDELGVSKDRTIRKRIGIHSLGYGGARQARQIIRWLYGGTDLYLERKLSRMEWWNG